MLKRGLVCSLIFLLCAEANADGTKNSIPVMETVCIQKHDKRYSYSCTVHGTQILLSDIESMKSNTCLKIRGVLRIDEKTNAPVIAVQQAEKVDGVYIACW